ncbi:hypothetical protein ACP4OV_001476 [Aristida adscensionis]
MEWNLENYVPLRGIGVTFSCLGSMSKWEPVTFEESLSFVKKVKARDYMLYLSLRDVLNRNDQIPLEAYSEAAFSALPASPGSVSRADKVQAPLMFKQRIYQRINLGAYIPDAFSAPESSRCL